MKPAIEFLRSLDPSGPAIVSEMRSVSAAITDELVGLLYGNIYQRPELTLRERLLVTVAAAAAGCLQPQLAYQSRLALLNGVSEPELQELCLQVAVFCGFGPAVNAMHVIAA